ncbi:hypothetical protein Ddc_09706 [Ditylenchus destructor]|nr:hypothetical protein Ddc_09706 [Ditylenchus destructor]
MVRILVDFLWKGLPRKALSPFWDGRLSWRLSDEGRRHRVARLRKKPAKILAQRTPPHPGRATCRQRRRPAQAQRTRVHSVLARVQLIILIISKGPFVVSGSAVRGESPPVRPSHSHPKEQKPKNNSTQGDTNEHVKGRTGGKMACLKRADTIGASCGLRCTKYNGSKDFPGTQKTERLTVTQTVGAKIKMVAQ